MLYILFSCTYRFWQFFQIPSEILREHSVLQLFTENVFCNFWQFSFCWSGSRGNLCQETQRGYRKLYTCIRSTWLTNEDAKQIKHSNFNTGNPPTISSWAVFFLVVWALYTGRHTYAKLTRAYAEWKVAYAEVFCLGLLTRLLTRELFWQQIWRSQLWSNFCLTFCGFISLYFGLL